MALTADVAVVGGGVIGASVAYHLAVSGARVVLVDREDRRGRGATLNSAAQVRMHHSDPYDARLAALGFEVFENWQEAIGGDCGFRRTGFALLLDEDHAGPADAMVRMLAAAGMSTTLLDPDGLAAEHPGLALDGVAAIAYEPRSGYADPVRTTGTLLDRAAALGADVLSCRDVALLRAGDRLIGLTADGMDVTAATVVLATGAWTQGVLDTAGLAPWLPLRTRRIGFCVIDASGIEARPALCMVIDDTAGIYFRPHGDAQILCGVPLDSWDVAPDAGVEPPDSHHTALATKRVDTRLPGAAEAPVLTTVATCDAYTADQHALIGPLPDVDGIYLATGFSGGGFKMAPAVGRGVAAELTTGGTRDELEPYRPRRFADGQPLATIRYRNM